MKNLWFRAGKKVIDAGCNIYSAVNKPGFLEEVIENDIVIELSSFAHCYSLCLTRHGLREVFELRTYWERS